MKANNARFGVITRFGLVIKDAFRLFRQNDPLRLAAATSFFASFALPPIMIILIEILGLFGDHRTVRHDLFIQLGVGLDKNIASQVREVLRNVDYLSLNQGLRVGGFIFLLFVATTLFEVIKSSMNQLWKMELKGHRSIAALLLDRLKSVGIILLAGVLFFFVLLWDVKKWFLPGGVNEVLYRIITTMAVISWFWIILRYLSYGRPAGKTALAGAAFTGILFVTGEILLHKVLTYDNMKAIYGTSTSLSLLLLFVFYCSFIFYFGACFTWALSVHTKQPIVPVDHAVVGG